jgi:hypothetical protein
VAKHICIIVLAEDTSYFKSETTIVIDTKARANGINKTTLNAGSSFFSARTLPITIFWYFAVRTGVKEVPIVVARGYWQRHNTDL